MEKLARSLAHNISSTLGYDTEKEAVIAYGLIALIQIIITILLVLFLGILVGVPVEALIVCFSASLLRKYSGGAHAETAELCTSISVVYCTLTAFISKKLSVTIYSPISMGLTLVIIFALSFFVVYRFAPVDSPNKPIRTEKKKKRMRKGSFILLSAYLILSVIFFVASYHSDLFKSYGISMLFGIGWQIFTLTSFGSLFLRKLNFRKEVRK